MVNDFFDADEQEQLNFLMVEAERAKERARARADVFFRTQDEKNIGGDEYAKRLERSLRKDNSIVDTVKHERIERSLADWRKRVGPRFANATTDIPAVTSRVARLAENRGTHKTSICLYGNLGVGKTWTSYAYINMAIAAGVVTAGQIVADTETGALSKIAVSGYKKPEMLEALFHERNKIYFIDEVGQGFFSDATKRQEIWFELIDHVYTQQLTLIITSNLDFGPQLSNWIGARAFDRLRALIGHDGYIEPGTFNRRPEVFQDDESKMLGSAPLPPQRPTNNMP